MAWVIVSVAVCVLLLQCHFVDVQGAPGDLGDVCENGNVCTNTTHHACDTNRDPPLCVLKIGETGCGENDSLCLDNGACSMDTCECGDSYVPNSDNTKCLLNLKVGQTGCKEDNSTCLYNGVCSNNTCECKTNYVPNSDNTMCLKQVDQDCMVSGECLENGECTNSTCSCKNGYKESADKGTCAGAAGITVSVLLLMFAALVTSRIEESFFRNC